MECHKCRLTYACRLSNIFLFLIEGIKCIILRVFFENAYIYIYRERERERDPLRRNLQGVFGKELNNFPFNPSWEDQARGWGGHHVGSPETP
jgi:hypothetical protein